MLRKDSKAHFEGARASFLNAARVYRFRAGSQYCTEVLDGAAYMSLTARQKTEPVCVMSDGRRTWWLFSNAFYVDDDGLSAEDVRTILLDRAEQARRHVRRAAARLAQVDPNDASRRKTIPDDVKLFVWQRDHGHCVKCGATSDLEFDHIIPIAKGGSSTARNLQLLCASCNRQKGPNIV